MQNNPVEELVLVYFVVLPPKQSKLEIITKVQIFGGILGYITDIWFQASMKNKCDFHFSFIFPNRDKGSYAQRSERFLNRNSDNSGRPSATPLYDIGVEIRPKKKYF